MPTPKTAKNAPARKLAPLTTKQLDKFLKPKPIKVVTRAVLERIADDIHNPKTGQYLNLCEGTLQNGPDPVCETRSMHCGLGELYFVVVGRQPEDDDVDEDGVVDVITKRSTIRAAVKAQDKQLKDAEKAIRKITFDQDLVEHLVGELNGFEYDDVEDEFREILGDIPQENDRGGENPLDFSKRAVRVAASIRAAAKLLPK